jgi:hypothetical protein
MIMTKKVYQVVSRVRTLDMYNEQDYCTISNEVFEDIGDARRKVQRDIGKFLGTNISWYDDAEGLEITEHRFDGETHTGEPCKRVARGEIRTLFVRPFSQ